MVSENIVPSSPFGLHASWIPACLGGYLEQSLCWWRKVLSDRHQRRNAIPIYMYISSLSPFLSWLFQLLLLSHTYYYFDIIVTYTLPRSWFFLLLHIFILQRMAYPPPPPPSFPCHSSTPPELMTYISTMSWTSTAAVPGNRAQPLKARRVLMCVYRCVIVMELLQDASSFFPSWTFIIRTSPIRIWYTLLVLITFPFTYAWGAS